MYACYCSFCHTEFGVLCPYSSIYVYADLKRISSLLIFLGKILTRRSESWVVPSAASKSLAGSTSSAEQVGGCHCLFGGSDDWCD